jgi:glyoxylase-like metal-dependent hydrolase (beta-lactamase superfamily II)
MRIVALDPPTTGYLCNSFLVLGTYNNPQDVTTVVDAGLNALNIPDIDRLSRGIGKSGVSQIVLTHNHYDHTAGLQLLVQRYRVRVLAAEPGPGVDSVLKDNDVLRMGDQDFQVLLTPGHSDDSLCLFCPATGDLFVGDTPYNILTPGGSYPPSLVISLRRLVGLPVKTIYSGHNQPVVERACETLRSTLSIVEQTIRSSGSGF